jgi:dienelactone hydrolase
VRRAAALCLLGALAVPGPQASAVSASCPTTGTYANPVCFSWQGTSWSERAVPVPRLPGALLSSYQGQVFEPTGPGPHPAVAVMHGLAGRMQNVWWLARDLAGHGYVVVTVTNSGSDAQTFTDAVLAMQKYLKDNAAALHVDLARTGVAGHSAGARAASLVQSRSDYLRAAAVVALDNLQSTEQGDAGGAVYNPSCLGGAQTPIPPTAPALGIAMDAPSYTCASTDPDVKKSAWSRWRAAGVPAVELVDKGSNHVTFAQTATTSASDGAQLHVPAYFARAWFDRWLKGDGTAVDRLLDPRAELGATRPALLSTSFRSAAFLPERGLDCGDLAATC